MRTRPSRTFPDETRLELRHVARLTWTFFERFVTAEDNFLPPDITRKIRRLRLHIAVRQPTSDCACSPRWQPAISAGLDCRAMTDRLTATLGAVDRLERFDGHFLNWYDTRSLAPLLPRYVSTVDSGNLAGHLLALRQACIGSGAARSFRRARWPVHWMRWRYAAKRWLPWGMMQHRQSTTGAGECTGAAAATTAATGCSTGGCQERPAECCAADRQSAADLGRHDVAGSRALAEGRRAGCRIPSAGSAAIAARPAGRCVDAQGTTGVHGAGIGSEDRLHAPGHCRVSRTIAGSGGSRLHRMLRDTVRCARTDFRTMPYPGCLDVIRLPVRSQPRTVLDRVSRCGRGPGPGFYDLLASEARLASLVAIAKGDVPRSHWARLGAG